MTENNGCAAGGFPKWQESLSEELWMQILSFVPPMEILQSVTRVSKTLHGCTVPHAYWLSHTKALLQDYHRQRHQGEAHLGLLEHTKNLNNHQLQRICLFLSARKQQPPQQDSDVNNESNHHNQHLPACLLHGSRLMTRAGAEAIRQQHYVVNTINQNRGNPNDGTIPLTISRRRVCLASSTDNPNELLENVLSGYHDEELLRNLGLFGLPRRQHHHDSKWWSSRASETQETCETLLFVTNCPLALLSELKWRPLLDPFTRRQAYTWRHAIVKAYQLPLNKMDPYPTADHAGFPCTVEALPEGLVTQRRRQRVNEFGHDDDDDDDMASDSDDDEDDNHINIQSTRQEANALRALLEGETPVYESPPLPYTLLQSQQQTQSQRTLQRNIPWQTLPFPPGMVIANAVTITLVGKDSRQFAHSGFYACVEQVKLEGMPLLKQAQEKEWVAGVSAAGAGVVRHLMARRLQQQQQEQPQERRLPDPPSDDDEFMDAEYGMDFDEVWNRTGG